MAYRNGTYIAFHANGTTDPTASDMKYYNLLKAWTSRGDDEFAFVNSHDKTRSIRDTSLHATIRAELVKRLRNSKHLLLIIGDTTREDNDWVPFEIRYAIDDCELPVIAAYTVFDRPIYNPSALSGYWPEALSKRIQDQTAGVIHIPFRKEPIRDAIGQFNHNKFPVGGSLGIYSKDAYRSFGLEA